MSRTAEKRAYFKNLGYNVIDTKIRQSRDDLLLIMQSEHKQLASKIDAHAVRLDSRIDGLELKIDAHAMRLDSRIDGLEERMDGFDKRMDGFDKRMDGFDKRMGRMENRMDEQTFQIVSMKKWAIGLFLAILLVLIALVAPFYFTTFF